MPRKFSPTGETRRFNADGSPKGPSKAVLNDVGEMQWQGLLDKLRRSLANDAPIDDGEDKRGVRENIEKELDFFSEQDETAEKVEMAETQLHFICYAAKEIIEYIKMGGKIEEWYQNKLSKVHSDLETLHSYVEGEKRRTGMVAEETESVNEDQVADWKKVQSMDRGSMTGGKNAMQKHLKYLNAVLDHQKKHGLDTLETRKKIENINRSLIAGGWRVFTSESEQVDEATRQETQRPTNSKIVAALARAQARKTKRAAKKDK